MTEDASQSSREPDCRRGRLAVISGPSGAGKSTIVRALLGRQRFPLALSCSATTRKPRPGEIDGVDYRFLSHEEFDRRKAAGEFLECKEVFGRGHWYGTLRDEVDRRLDEGKTVILEIDVQGMLAVREKCPDLLTFFVEPESEEELERRLTARNTDSLEDIRRRLEVARREWEIAPEYRYRIVNRHVDQAVADIEAALAAEGVAEAPHG